MEQSGKNIVAINNIDTYEELFRTHYSNLCAYAKKYVEELDTAEEIVQEVFVKLWEHRETIEINSNYRSYLFRAVHNACLNLIRHIHIREEYKTYNQQELEEGQKSIEEEMFASELEVKIREAIDQLPIERRRVFVMSRYEGLKHKEIAAKLKISDKTVKNQVGMAIKFLKEKLTEYLILILLYYLVNK